MSAGGRQLMAGRYSSTINLLPTLPETLSYTEQLYLTVRSPVKPNLEDRNAVDLTNWRLINGPPPCNKLKGFLNQSLSYMAINLLINKFAVKINTEE